MEKILCRKCQTIKPVTAFQQNRRVCKDCRNKRNVELYHENIEHSHEITRMKNRRYKDSRTPKQKKQASEYQKAYSKKPEVAARKNSTARERYWQNRDDICKKNREKYKLKPKPPTPREPYKNKCHALFQYAVKMGRIKKQPCIICGKFPAEGHHHDYWKPLEVIWLCRKHHAALHREAFCLYPRLL